MAGYSWRDSSCPGAGHHKQPERAASCRKDARGLQGPSPPTCPMGGTGCSPPRILPGGFGSRTNTTAEALPVAGPEFCLPSQAAPPLTDGISSGLQISPTWTPSHCHLSVVTSHQRCDCRWVVSCMSDPCPIPLWLQPGASRVRFCRFPYPRRSCPRRTTKTDQILNWAEEHHGLGHLKAHGPQEHGPTPNTTAVCSPLVVCHLSVC